MKYNGLKISIKWLKQQCTNIISLTFLMNFGRKFSVEVGAFPIDEADVEADDVYVLGRLYTCCTVLYTWCTILYTRWAFLAVHGILVLKINGNVNQNKHTKMFSDLDIKKTPMARRGKTKYSREHDSHKCSKEWLALSEPTA